MVEKCHGNHPNAFARTELMFGASAVRKLAEMCVAIVGVGGVGGWCAESLVRSGIGNFILIDPDAVNETNLNRQLVATTATIGQRKVAVLAARMKAINPDCVVQTFETAYTAESAAQFGLETCDYVVDAIDSVTDKVALIRHVLGLADTTLFSSMGAALKTNPSEIKVSAFQKIAGDGLARALRNRFRATGGIPQKKWTCVWSAEHRQNLGNAPQPDELAPIDAHKARINGTIAHLPALFGFTLAGAVVNHALGVS